MEQPVLVNGSFVMNSRYIGCVNANYTLYEQEEHLLSCTWAHDRLF